MACVCMMTGMNNEMRMSENRMTDFIMHNVI